MALTANEYKLLEIMMKTGKCFSREFLYEQAWEGTPAYNDRTVDVTISRLRKKILELPEKYFHAVRGIGYRLGGSHENPVPTLANTFRPLLSCP